MPESDYPVSNQPSHPEDSPDSVALPDLLAGLLDNAMAQGWREPEDNTQPFADPSQSRQEVLEPEVLPPEKPGNTAPAGTQPTIEDMQQFLTGLRAVLENSSPAPEALDDFADLTSSLLRSMAEAVAAQATTGFEPSESATSEHPPAATTDLLEQLLSKAETEEILQEHPANNAEPADLGSLQRELLEGLLVQSDPELSFAFHDARNELLSSLIDSLDGEEAGPAAGTPAQIEAVAEPAAPELGEPCDAVAPETWTHSEPPSPETVASSEQSDAPCPPELDGVTDFDGMTRGLLDGLISRVQGTSAQHEEVLEDLFPLTELEPTAPLDSTREGVSPSSSLGEVPLHFVDESDPEIAERPASAFDLLLDAIDASIGPAPALDSQAATAASLTSGLERLVAFQVAGRSYALPLDHVLETDIVPPVTFVPGLAGHVEGVANLRGEIIPVVDLRKWSHAAVNSGDARMLVVRDAGGATRQPAAGFVVDRLAGLLAVSRSSLEPPPSGHRPDDEPLDQILRGTCSHRGSVIGVLDPPKLLAAACYENSITEDN